MPKIHLQRLRACSLMAGSAPPVFSRLCAPSPPPARLRPTLKVETYSDTFTSTVYTKPLNSAVVRELIPRPAAPKGTVAPEPEGPLRKLPMLPKDPRLLLRKLLRRRAKTKARENRVRKAASTLQARAVEERLI